MMDERVRYELQKQSSTLHDTLLVALKNRLRASSRRWGQRHMKWRESERLYRAFRDPDTDDRETASRGLTEGVQKIVVPYTYAQIQSMLAFLVTVFTDRKPIVPIEPVGDYMKAAIVHEHLLEYQFDRMRPRGLLVMIQWFLDALRYDCGIIKNTWTIREWTDLKRVVMPDGAGGVIDEVIEDDIVDYEGNEARNVSPFDFYPDPNRSLAEFQQGEFVFHRMRRSPTELATKEAEGLYTGIDWIGRRGTSFHDSFTSLASKSANPETVGMGSTDFTQGGPIDEYDDGYVTLHEGWWFCRPQDLGLPTNRMRDLPTLWVFTIANENRIIRAEAANLPGRRFPFALIQTNYDIHSPATPSMVEVTSGLQYHLSWLFNARMAAVRKTLNNELIADPGVLEMVDLEEPNMSGIIRINKDHYGTAAARDAVFPLPVQDVTQRHLADAGIVQELMETCTGANKLIQGLGNTGRRSATEVQSQLNLSSGRMKLIAAVYAAQGMSEWAEICIANTQTFFGQRLQLPVNQAYRDVLQANMMTITPEILQGVFRVPWLESGIPTDKSFHANTLREIFSLWMQGAATNPAAMQLMTSINGVEVYLQLLRLLGIRNVQDFVMQPQPMPQIQAMPDEQVAQQEAAGNLVPAQGSDGNMMGPMGPGAGSDAMGMGV